MVACSGKLCEVRDACAKFAKYQTCDIDPVDLIGSAMCINIMYNKYIYSGFVSKREINNVENTNFDKRKK